MNQLERPNSYGNLATMNDRNRILYSEQSQQPTYSVQRYVSYLKTYVADTSKTTACQSTSGNNKKRNKKQDLVNPLSYFLRKLKLDLKMSYSDFVSKLIQAPFNGLHLLIALLKNIHGSSGKTVGSLPRGRGGGTLNIEDYKQNMVDELDCLLCIKYTMRIAESLNVITEDNTGLFIIVSCCLGRYSKSRIVALEILTLLITNPSAVDKVLDAFTAIRVQYSETTRFKMLINLLHIRGVVNVIFQINTLRLLNSLLNMCKSPNMRVFLQYEMEEAGLDLNVLQQSAQKPGLEYDDLNKQILEWKTRYIDVNSLLKIVKLSGNYKECCGQLHVQFWGKKTLDQLDKFGVRKDFPSQAMSDYLFDQQYGNRAGSRLFPGHAGWMSSLNQEIDNSSGNGRWQNRQETQQPNTAYPSNEIIFYKGKDIYMASQTDLPLGKILIKDNADNITIPEKQPRPHPFFEWHSLPDDMIYEKNKNTRENTFNHYDTVAPNRIDNSIVNNDRNSTALQAPVASQDEMNRTCVYDDNWVFANPNIKHSHTINDDRDRSQRHAAYDSGVSEHAEGYPSSRKPDARGFVWTLESHSQQLFYTGPDSQQLSYTGPTPEEDRTHSEYRTHENFRLSKRVTENETISVQGNPAEKVGDARTESQISTELPCDIQEYKPKNINRMSTGSEKQKRQAKTILSTEFETNSLSENASHNRFSHSANVVSSKGIHTDKASSSTSTLDSISNNTENIKGGYDEEVNHVLMELDRTLAVHGDGRDSVKSAAMATNKTFMAYI